MKNHNIDSMLQQYYTDIEFDERKALKNEPELSYKQKSAIFDEFDELFHEYLKTVNITNEPIIDMKALAPEWIKKISTKLGLIKQLVQDALDKYWDVEIDSDGDIILSSDDDDDDELDINKYCFRAPKSKS